MKKNVKFLFLILILINYIYTTKVKLSIELSSKNTNLKSSLTTSNLSLNNFKAKSLTLLKSKLTTKYCNPLCSQCSTNDLNFCTICQTNTVFYNYSCYENCPEGTFLNESNSCQTCHDDCPLCWGAGPDMCGTEKGIKTKVVTLEQEIQNFLLTYTFTSKEIDEWISTLKIILEKGRDDELLKDLNSDNFSTSDIYDLQKADVELPQGSYSKFDGVFIPIPSYLNVKKELVNSHWVYKKGMWDGQRWVQQYYPRLPKFIRQKGNKNYLYYENGGYWIWNSYRGWFWMVSTSGKKNKFEQTSNIQDNLAMLNGIKIDLGDYAKRKWRERMEVKKLSIQNNIREFFDRFLNSDTLIFNEMKHTMFEEQNNLINSLDDLKGQVHNYFGEESELIVKPQDDVRISKFIKLNRKKLPEIKIIDNNKFKKKKSEEEIHTKINIDAFSEIPVYVKSDKLNDDLQQVTNSYHQELTKQLFNKINNSFNVK